MLTKVKRGKSVVGSMLRRFFRQGNSAPNGFPRTVVLKALLDEGCIFEITNSVEAFRVEELGAEEEFSRLILAEIRPTDVVFDIGASIGLVSVHAAKLARKVVAFEPDPSIRLRLVTNLKLNALENVEVIDWAVSNQSGSAMLYTNGVQGNSPSLRKTGNTGTIEIQTDSLDHAIEEGRLPWPDVMKIDIEGAEALALNGMRALLVSEKAPRTIFIEIHPDFIQAFGGSADEVERLFVDLGYEPTYEVVRALQTHVIYRKRGSQGI